MTSEQIAALTRAAASAPSADNRHPWLLSFREAECRGEFIAPAWLDAPQTPKVLALISLGTAVEGMAICARAMGLSLQLEYRLSDESAPLGFSLAPIETSDDSLAVALDARHSNRNFWYRGPPLSSVERQALRAENSNLEAASIEWLNDRDTRKAAVELIQAAETERFRNKALHQELYGGVRFDVGWHRSAEEGLPPGALGVSWFERMPFSAMRAWPVQQCANLIGAHHLLGMRSAGLPCRLAPDLCSINADGPTDEAAVHAGRLLMRIWCRATLMGLACQVYAAAPVYALPGATNVSPALQARLSEGWSRLVPNGRPYILMRMGRADAPAVRTARRDFATYLAAVPRA
jgi:hypothetical protein